MIKNYEDGDIEISFKEPVDVEYIQELRRNLAGIYIKVEDQWVRWVAAEATPDEINEIGDK